MKKYFVIPVMLLLMGFMPSGRKLSPFVKVGEVTGNINAVMMQVRTALEKSSFEVLGTYHPAGKNHLAVIAFTRRDLKNTVVKSKDRGALAAVLKIGLQAKNGKTVVSYTTPEYMFRAYLGDKFSLYKSALEKVERDLIVALRVVGRDFMPFGGSVPADELKKYHYKIMMPYFTDPVTLKKFSSFDEGLRTITANLKAGKSGTRKVFSLIYTDKKIAVFGVGLTDTETGEAHFLPKIGESHVAAMPYEIILQGNTATMLHGRYRLALYWPGLSMGTFMTIVSTPGNIEDAMRSLCN